MKKFKVLFEVIRTLEVEIEAESEEAADKIADEIEVQEIEERGAGNGTTNVNIIRMLEAS